MLHEPFCGDWVVLKCMALTLVAEAEEYVTSKRQYSISGCDRNRSLADVKFVVFHPERTTK